MKPSLSLKLTETFKKSTYFLKTYIHKFFKIPDVYFEILISKLTWFYLISRIEKNVKKTKMITILFFNFININKNLILYNEKNILIKFFKNVVQARF